MSNYVLCDHIHPFIKKVQQKEVQEKMKMRRALFEEITSFIEHFRFIAVFK